MAVLDDGGNVQIFMSGHSNFNKSQDCWQLKSEIIHANVNLPQHLIFSVSLSLLNSNKVVTLEHLSSSSLPLTFYFYCLHTARTQYKDLVDQLDKQQRDTCSEGNSALSAS